MMPVGRSDLKIRKIFLDVLRSGGEFNPHVVRKFEDDIFRIAKTFGVEQEIFYNFKKYIRLDLFSLQSKIYREKVIAYVEFLKRLKSVGNFILMKGLGVAQKYYKNILGRHIGDIDILVPEEEKVDFVLFFSKIGMRRSRLSEIKKKFGHSEQFFAGDISVGLHTYLCDRFFAELKYEDVETQKVFLEIGRKSVEVLTLDNQWDLIELSLHAFQHAFALRILLDIYKVLFSKPDLRKVDNIVRKFNLGNMVLVSSLSSLKFFSNDMDMIKRICSEFSFSFIDLLFSDFISSEFFLFDFRQYLYSIPYLDKIFSLIIARRFPFKKVLSIIPYLPKEFIRRYKGVYDTTI